jgi:hypothetical protein
MEPEFLRDTRASSKQRSRRDAGMQISAGVVLVNAERPVFLP